jgi:competence protein ComEC
MSQWPLNKSWFWERAPFFRLLLPLIAGIVCYKFFAAFVPIKFAIACFCSCAIIYVTLLIVKSRSTFKSIITSVAVHCFLLSAAWVLCYQYDIRNDTAWFGNYVERADYYKATITRKPVEKVKTWKVEVDVKGVSHSEGFSHTKGKAFVYLYKNTGSLTLNEGDIILLPPKWQRIKNAGNPYEFDYAGYAAGNNMYYQQFLAPSEILLYKKANKADVSWVSRTHDWCMKQLERYIHHKPTLGLMQAMIADIRQAYAETGIIHIVAISGSHITIFFFLFSFLLGWIKHKRLGWLKYLLAIPLIWVYVVIAGAPPSAVRAALMFSLLGIGFAFQKQNSSLNQLFATAFLLLLAQPNWLFAVGFQLSFLAVLSIIIFYKPVYKLLKAESKVLNALWQAVAVSIAAEILVAPLVVYYFHLFPAMFIVANLAAYLFMGVVLVLGLLVIAFSSIPSMAALLASLITWLVGIFNQLVLFFKTLNPHSFQLLMLNGFELMLLYFTIAALAVYWFRQYRAAFFAAGISSCVLSLSFIYGEFTALRQKKLIAYNVGKATHVEIIKGKTFSVIATDTNLSPLKLSYAVKPAHIALKANEQVAAGRNVEYLLFGGQKVLLIHENPHFDEHLTADYVIINYKAPPGDLQKLQSMFRPQLIIANGGSAKNKLRLLAEARKAHIKLHLLQDDGAFVLGNE